ncbi:hypothetical protein [Pseudoxanthomonas japonensis]|uniref:hypothetical protein n=1 Tax=Pseudoxanthomonas japonensis TaxID=69284 RepID=UPI00374A1CD6
MADRYYSGNLGADLPLDITESATATPAAFVDVRVTYTAAGANKLEVAKLLDAVKNRILERNWPPV